LKKALVSIKESQVINVSKGVRLDTNNHNWIILSEYLSLGFSYMTFVIKEQNEFGMNEEN
jgi:hypothetical protein